jgi:hypothetical protein
MFLDYFTLIHILISIVGIVAGFGMLSGLMTGVVLPRWTAWFLWMTIATSVTGFFFPFKGMTPALVFGVLSLIVLTPTVYAVYVKQLAGRWRDVFIVTAIAALYLNFFVLIAQMFQKMPALITLAPTQSEPAFAVTQGVTLLAFIALGVTAWKRRLA